MFHIYIPRKRETQKKKKKKRSQIPTKIDTILGKHNKKCAKSIWGNFKISLWIN